MMEEFPKLKRHIWLEKLWIRGYYVGTKGDVRVNLMQQIREEDIASGKAGLWWLGQAGYIIKSCDGIIIAIDPYLSNHCAKENPGSSRTYPAPIRPEELKCDLYLFTHNHDDHLDPETVQNIQSGKDAVFVGPRNCCRHLREMGIREESITLLESGEDITVHGINVKGTFCLPTDEDVLDSIGFLISFPNSISIYHAGDTGYIGFLHYLSKYSIEVMLVCINGKYGNMNLIEAAKLSRVLAPRVVIPNHYDMFKNNQANPYEFEKLILQKSKHIKCRILSVGEKWIYPEADR